MNHAQAYGKLLTKNEELKRLGFHFDRSGRDSTHSIAQTPEKIKRSGRSSKSGDWKKASNSRNSPQLLRNSTGNEIDSTKPQEKPRQVHILKPPSRKIPENQNVESMKASSPRSPQPKLLLRKSPELLPKSGSLFGSTPSTHSSPLWSNEVILQPDDFLATTDSGQILSQDFRFCDNSFTRLAMNSPNTSFAAVAVISSSSTYESKKGFLKEFYKNLSGQSEEKICSFQPNGIFSYLVESSAQKIMLLDTPPMNSVSDLVSFAEKWGSSNLSLPHGIKSVAQLHSYKSIQKLIFLLSFCHSIVLVPDSDDFSDMLALLRTLRLALVSKNREISEIIEGNLESVVAMFSAAGGDKESIQLLRSVGLDSIRNHCANLIVKTDSQPMRKIVRDYMADLFNVSEVSPDKPMLRFINSAAEEALTNSFRGGFFSEEGIAQCLKGAKMREAGDRYADILQLEKVKLSEKQWFESVRNFWMNFDESAVSDDLKHILGKGVINMT